MTDTNKTNIRDTSADKLCASLPRLERLEQVVYDMLVRLGPTHDQRLLEALVQDERLKPKEQRHKWTINCLTGRRYYCVGKGWVEDLGAYRGQWNDRPATYHIWRAKWDTREPVGWQKVEKSEHICHRCGQCCMDVGPNMWMESEHPLIHKIIEQVGQAHGFGDTGPCGMLVMHGDTSTCMLQKYLGKAAKPDVCRKYPVGMMEDDKCAREQPDWLKAEDIENSVQGTGDRVQEAACGEQVQEQLFEV